MIRTRRARSCSLALLAWLTGCASEGESNPAESACSIEQRSISLPAGLTENSGIAIGRRAPDVLWMHNDSGDDPVVYAVDVAGRLIGPVRIEGARNRDWEDIESGPCPSGSCLYIGDIGDNSEKRDGVDIYRVPEPDPRSSRSVAAERFQVRYPEGPRDAEALFVLPSGELFIVTKGIKAPVELFRYPLPLRADETVELEKVATLRSAARDEVLRVTGASASPNGEWVAIRAYRSLMMYRTDALLQGDSEPVLVVDLSPVGEAQGEAVAVTNDGSVLLGSEGASKRVPGTLALLACRLPG